MARFDIAICKANFIHRPIFYPRIVWLWKPIGEVVQVLGNANSLEQLGRFCSIVRLDVEFLCLSLENLRSQQFRCTGPCSRCHLEQILYYAAELCRELGLDLRVDSLHNFFVEPFHVFSSEGGSQSSHLVDDAAKRPHVGLGIIGLVAPDFGAELY